MRCLNGTLGPVKEKNISVTVDMGYETFYTGWSNPNMRLFNQLFRELFASHKILYFNCRRSEDKLSKYLYIQLWTATAHVLNRTEQVVHTHRTSCRNDWPRGFHDFTAISLCHTKPVTFFLPRYQDWSGKRNETASVDRLLVKKRTLRISGIFATFSRYPEGFSWALVVILVNPLSNQRDNENGYTEIFHF